MSNLFSIDDSIGWFLLGLCPAWLYQGQPSWGLGTKTVITVIPLGAAFRLRARQRRRGALERVVCGASRRDERGARDREGLSTENWLANPVVIRAETVRDYPSETRTRSSLVDAGHSRAVGTESLYHLLLPY